MTATTDTNMAAVVRQRGYLHHPWVDFICLGGGSLIVICLLVMLPPEEYRAYTIATVMLLSHFINAPHFMHSYQIFYNGFPEKAAPGAALRNRYLFAGIGVPALMVMFFAWCVATGDPISMGLAVNLMLFTVGWHYAKQGYGILMVESVLKRAFFTDREKTWLRGNALVIWAVSWVVANQKLAEQDFYGLTYITFGVPDWLFWAVMIVAGSTTLITAQIIARKALKGPVAWNGLAAYMTSAYVWLVLSQYNILLTLVVPCFHSLQYLAVVWRYKLNREQAVDDAPEKLLGLLNISRAHVALIRFVWIATVAGAVFFWVIPLRLDVAISYQEQVFGTSMFLFMFVVFINVHHYFLDNVMWRRENPDIKQYLFS